MQSHLPLSIFFLFFFNDPATTEIYTLSLHDALPISFLTPPFGFALFYLRGVAPPSIATAQIYRGVIPFILIQLLMLGILAIWPDLATWLPHQLYD